MIKSRKRNAEPTDVVVYCRLSLDKRGDSLGVARQEAECRAYAAEHGWTVSAVYVDNDMSATKKSVRRPAFERLLVDRPPHVLAWNMDRLVRVSRDLERVIDAGLTVFSIQASTVDLSTPTGKAVARTVVAWSTQEGDIRAERQYAAFRQMAEDGRQWWSHRPFGFELPPKAKKGKSTPPPAHRESEAAELRQAYAAILNGETVASVARDWNARGLTTPTGKAWYGRDVTDLLKAPRNAGLRIYQGDVVGLGAWAPIVDEATWRAVVSVLTDPARRTNPRGGSAPTAMLTGVATCAKCGAPITLGRLNDQTGERQYWCSASSRCGVWPQGWADAVVTRSLVAELDSRPVVSGTEKGREAEALSLRAEQENVRAKMKQLAEAWGTDAITWDQMQAASAQLRERLATIDKELDALQTRSPIDGVGRDAGGSLFVVTEDGKRELSTDALRSLVAEAFTSVTFAPRGKGRRVLSLAQVECVSRATGEPVTVDPSVPVITAQGVFFGSPEAEANARWDQARN